MATQNLEKSEAKLGASDIRLSPYQRAILEAVRDRLALPAGSKRPGLLIEALAGSGKSTMLVEVCRLLKDQGVPPDAVRCIVFGKKNKSDLAGKMAAKVGRDWAGSVSTIHSLSFEVLRVALGKEARFFKVEGTKYRKIAENLKLVAYRVRSHRYDGLLTTLGAIDGDRDFLDCLEKLRLYCLEPSVENVQFVAKKHYLGILNPQEVAKAAEQCLARGLREAKAAYWIDFTDQSWVLWKERQQPAFQAAFNRFKRQLRAIFVDEAQDTDQLQIEILSLLHDPIQSFVCPVGDRHQAVYSFRGCLADGLDKMAERFECAKLPLPVNYRCGTRHLELVREIYPEIAIEPHPDAPPGHIRCIKEQDFLKIFEQGSDFFGICRKNAPLTKFAVLLLANGKPAKIKDKELGSRLIAMVRDICKKMREDYDPAFFSQTLSRFSVAERSRLERYPDNEARIDELEDRLTAIETLFEAYEPQTIEEWGEVVARIFDEGESPINLYTIHSGKGGEGEVTFLLYPDLMPLKHRRQTEEEAEQEENMIYVSLTRPNATTPDTGILYLVLSDKEGVPIWPKWLPSEHRTIWKWGQETEPEILETLETQRKLPAVVEVVPEAVEAVPKSEQSFTESNDTLTPIERDRLRELEAKVDRALYDAGAALREISEKRLYRESYSTFEDYCRERWGKTKRAAYYLIDAANVIDSLRNSGFSMLPNSEYVCRQLKGVHPDDAVDIWDKAIAAADGKPPTAEIVRAVKAEVLGLGEESRKPAPKIKFLEREIRSAGLSREELLALQELIRELLSQ